MRTMIFQINSNVYHFLKCVNVEVSNQFPPLGFKCNELGQFPTYAIILNLTPTQLKQILGILDEPKKARILEQ